MSHHPRGSPRLSSWPTLTGSLFRELRGLLSTSSEGLLLSGGSGVGKSVLAGQLVDAATTADNRYTPSNAKREARKVDTQAMYKGWQKAYRELVKKRPNMPETWYAQQIAKLPVAKGRNAGTIKKNMHA